MWHICTTPSRGNAGSAGGTCLACSQVSSSRETSGTGAEPAGVGVGAVLREVPEEYHVGPQRPA